MFKYFLSVLLVSSAFSAYRPYEIAINGPKTQATGGVSSSPLLSAENLYNNPAFIISLDRTLLHYELDANLRFRGITRDYKLSFDTIVSAGFLYHSPTAEKKPWRKYGIVLSTLYRNDSDGQVGVPSMNVKRLGYAQALPIGKKASLGYNLSAAFGLWKGNFSVFPSFQLGYGHSVHPKIVIGANFLSPLYLNWGLATANRVRELTPYTITFGGKFRLSSNIAFLTEIAYQGWDSVYFEEAGVREPLDKGKHPFDWYQNVFMNFGFYIHGETKGSRDASKKKISALTLKHREAIFKYENEIKEAQKDYDRESIAAEINELFQQRKILYERRQPYVSGDTANVDQAELSKLSKEIGILRKQKRAKKQELDNIDVLFGAKELRAKLNEEIAKIDNEMTVIELKKKSLSKIELSEQESQALAKINDEIKGINQVIQLKIKKEKTMGKNYIRVRNEILDRGDRGEKLNEEDLRVYQKEIKLKELRNSIEKERKEIRRLKRKNRLPIKGQYYVSYHPEVAYQEDGKYLKMGNISIGFSFSPPRNENLYFSFSLTDKSLLRFTNIHPDNDPSERIKASVRYTF